MQTLKLDLPLLLELDRLWLDEYDELDEEEDDEDDVEDDEDEEEEEDLVRLRFRFPFSRPNRGEDKKIESFHLNKWFIPKD